MAERQSEKKQLQSVKRDLSEHCNDFWCSRVKRIDVPSTVEFLRDSVSAYHPVIIKSGLIDRWPARHKWDLAYLETICKSNFPVNITPDGRADSIQIVDGEPTFCYPAETHMNMATFRAMMESPEADDAVAYLSEQDNNLVKSFPELQGDISSSIPLADEAFGCLPEATNLWIGDERSVSSLHKDHFENMYVVLSGEKTFTLLPPSDAAFLPELACPTLRHTIKEAFLSDDGEEGQKEGTSQDQRLSHRRLKKCHLGTTMSCPTETLTWISVDVDATDAEQQHPELFSHIRPLRCTVHAGETLYIPALWYHQVSQTQLTISVNYWYEMKFDFRYVFHQLASSLNTKKVNMTERDTEDKEEELR